MKWLAEHLGWKELRHDTLGAEWKFNFWHFYDPVAGGPRHARTEEVQLKHPLPAYRSPAGVRGRARSASKGREGRP